MAKDLKYTHTLCFSIIAVIFVHSPPRRQLCNLPLGLLTGMIQYAISRKWVLPEPGKYRVAQLVRFSSHSHHHHLHNIYTRLFTVSGSLC